MRITVLDATAVRVVGSVAIYDEGARGATLSEGFAHDGGRPSLAEAKEA